MRASPSCDPAAPSGRAPLLQEQHYLLQEKLLLKAAPALPPPRAQVRGRPRSPCPSDHQRPARGSPDTLWTPTCHPQNAEKRLRTGPGVSHTDTLLGGRRREAAHGPAWGKGLRAPLTHPAARHPG